MSAIGHLRHEDVLRAVGAFIDQGGWHDIVVLQLQDRVMLKGTRIERVHDEVIERMDAAVLTEDDVRNILETSRRRRRPAIQRITSPNRIAPTEAPRVTGTPTRRWPFGTSPKPTER